MWCGALRFGVVATRTSSEDDGIPTVHGRPTARGRGRLAFLLKSSHFVLELPSMSFSGFSLLGVLPPGLLT